MNSKRSVTREKKINPHFWVFCEGKTEEAYVCFLRSEYRLPIEIIPKVAGCDINNRYIQSFKKGKFTHIKDKDFLVFDADVPEVLEKLIRIESAMLIASNPAVELWFLLHYKNQKTPVTESDCIKELCNRNRITYKKGIIDPALLAKLKENYKEACNRAKKLVFPNNPSSNMYLLIEALEKAKTEKHHYK